MPKKPSERFPCRIHYRDVYELVAEALVEIVNSNSHEAEQSVTTFD